MPDMPKTSAALLAALGDNALSDRWSEFADLYVPMLRRYCAAKFHGLDADDLVQETLLALVSALPHYRYDPEAKGHFHNYLLGILRHKAFAQYAKRKRGREVEERWFKESADPSEEKGEDVRQAALELALRDLLADPSIQERTKQIFLQVAVESRPPAEVAVAFGITRNAVDQIRSRLTAQLRKIVKNLGG